MEAETIVEVARQLVGPLEPVGESHTDSERYENLDKAHAVIQALMADLSQVCRHHIRAVEFSRSKAGKQAQRIINEIRNP